METRIIPDFAEEYEEIVNKNLNDIGFASRILYDKTEFPKTLGHYITRPLFNLKYFDNFPTKEGIGEIKTNRGSTILQSAALENKITNINLIAYDTKTKNKLKKIKNNLEKELNIPINVTLNEKSTKIIKKYFIELPILQVQVGII